MDLLSALSKMRWLTVLAAFSAACSEDPKLPSEAEARKAVRARAGQLQRVVNAVQAGISDAGLTTARESCTPADDACLQRSRERDELIAAASGRIVRELSALDVACAEVTITSGSITDELEARIASCPPGRRGDLVAPKAGFEEGGYHVGWGVYHRSGETMRPGIAVHRVLEDGAATARIDAYLFIRR